MEQSPNNPKNQSGIEISDLERLNHELRQILYQALNADSPQQAKVLTEKAQKLRITIDSSILEFKKRLDPYDIGLRSNLAKEFGYEYVGQFSKEGLAVAQSNSEYFYINQQGKQPLGLRFKWAGKIDRGHARVSNFNNQYQILNINQSNGINKITFSSSYEQIDERGDNDIYPIRINRGKRGYLKVNTDNMEEQFEYTFCTSFREGLALVCFNNQDKLYYIDENYKQVLGGYYAASLFSEGLAPIQSKLGHNYHYINKLGEKVLPKKNRFGWDKYRFEEAQPFSGGWGLISLNEHPGYTFINHKGDLLTKNYYNDASNFQEGFAVVRTNEGYNYIDTNNKPLLKYKGIFEARSFAERRAWFRKNDWVDTDFYHLIDLHGEEILKKEFKHVGEFKDGVCIVYDQTGKKIFLDRNGRRVF